MKNPLFGRTLLAGEVARRMFNTSPELVESDVMCEILDKFRFKLMTSGYNEGEREVIIREGVSRYWNVVKLVDRGLRPLYRSSAWKKEERALEKKVKGRSWYGDKESVVFVQATPGEALRKKVQDIMISNGFKVKVAEKGGRQVKSLLQKSDVMPRMTCPDPTCRVCEVSPDGKCSIEGVVYKVVCVDCEQNGIDTAMYGETGRTAKVRYGEHVKALNSKYSSNLREHCERVHGGVLQEFRCKVIKIHCPDNLQKLTRFTTTREYQ